MSPLDLLLVFVGGGAGAAARFAVGELFRGRGWSAAFPWHTFLINVLGSFALGLLVVASKDRPQLLRLLGVGVCGGFTTFSTFSVEVVRMMEEERFGAVAGYVVGSVLAAVVGAWVGMRLAR